MFTENQFRESSLNGQSLLVTNVCRHPGLGILLQVVNWRIIWTGFLYQQCKRKPQKAFRTKKIDKCRTIATWRGVVFLNANWQWGSHKWCSRSLCHQGPLTLTIPPPYIRNISAMTSVSSVSISPGVCVSSGCVSFCSRYVYWAKLWADIPGTEQGIIQILSSNLDKRKDKRNMHMRTHTYIHAYTHAHTMLHTHSLRQILHIIYMQAHIILDRKRIQPDETLNSLTYAMHPRFHDTLSNMWKGVKHSWVNHVCEWVRATITW